MSKAESRQHAAEWKKSDTEADPRVSVCKKDLRCKPKPSTFLVTVSSGAGIKLPFIIEMSYSCLHKNSTSGSINAPGASAPAHGNDQIIFSY